MRGLGLFVTALGLASSAAHAAHAAHAAPPRPAAPTAPASAPIRRIETRERAVAITFDACATRTHGYGFDRKVYDILKAGGVPATIFVSGRWVDFHPAEMAELARDPLITFGDHSFDHPHMSRLPSARAGQEITQTEAALARYGKKSVAFRPPFGDWSPRVIDVVHEQGLPTVTWDVVSGDPSARTTKAGMIRNVVDHAKAGSIVIFHINGRGLKTAEALPEILRDLRARGLRFVPLGDLLALRSLPTLTPSLAKSSSEKAP